MPSKPLPSESSNQETLAWGTDQLFVGTRDLTGTTLGDFAIERRLGRGGMGEVYLARQTSLKREIALKVIRPDLIASPTALARFEKEAWAAAKLNDPNIVHIYVIGSIEKVHFIAMEYVQGTNLKDYIDRKGPPDLPLALSIMKQASNALRAAGETGLIHRDIKPENILITRRGLVKVADFGLCRDQNDLTGPSITQPEVAMGTPTYMSPEQAQGFPLDHRSDLYSLGITFYQMLAGQPPFKADTPIALALKHVKDVPADLARVRPDLPPDLCQLVMRLIAKSPAERFQSAAEILRELARIKESIQTTSVSGQSLSIALPQTEVKTPSLSRSTNQPNMVSTSLGDSVEPTMPALAILPGRLRNLLKVGVALLCVLGGLAGWQARPTDLLSPPAGRTVVETTPAIWMFPDWTKIPKQATAQAQYRYALIESSNSQREAAWVAVAGHHPTIKEWISKSFTQLGRELFQDRDVTKLKVFVEELARTGRGHDDRLAEIVKVGIGVLESDPDVLINAFGRETFIGTLADPSLAELGLEITNAAITNIKTQGAKASMLDKLTGVQRALMLRMMEITLRDTFGRAPF